MMEIMETGKRRAPWIGVGKSGEWDSIDAAMEDCGLDFHVKKYDAQFSYDEEGMTYYTDIPWVQATVREDTHRPLGVVSETYKIVQNREIFSMLQPFMDAGARVTNGGMTLDGLCFMVLRMDQIDAGGDSYEMNIMATNSFNGKYPAAMICTPVRIICQNMYRSLMGSKDNVMRFRHSLKINDRLAAIKEAYGMFTTFKGDFTQNVEHLKQMEAKHTIDEFLEVLFPYTDADPSSKRYEYLIDRVDEKRAFYKNNFYYSDTNDGDGSCFALVNAYYDYMSHMVQGNKPEFEYASNRLSKIVGGQAVKPSLMQYMCESK